MQEQQSSNCVTKIPSLERIEITRDPSARDPLNIAPRHHNGQLNLLRISGTKPTGATEPAAGWCAVWGQSGAKLRGSLAE